MKTEFLIVILTILIFLSGCKSRADFLKEAEEEKKKFDKYDDEYESYKYTNGSLGLNLVFDSDWVLNIKFSSFDDFQKKFARYFSNNTDEVLFIGFNKEKRIGIKCLCQGINLDNKKFSEMLKEESLQDVTDYKITFIKENTEITLKNINAIQSIYDVTINTNNQFRFITTLFSKNNFNYKLDLWINKNLYEPHIDYIDKIINSVDFVEVAEKKQ